jgi:PAS domain S-box-containing protein
MNKIRSDGPPTGGRWPDPRLRALQVDELYRLAPTAAGFSYLGALLTLGVLIETGDITRGAVWFLWATAVTFFRFITVVAYRRRDPASDPVPWGRLVISANLLAGVQWGMLGTLLFPSDSGFRQLFTVMVITCFVGGSLMAYAPVRWAHEALSIPATVPTTINLFFIQDGVHWFAGLTAALFCFAIVYYARKLNRHVEDRFRLEIERDELLELTILLKARLEEENRELAHRAAVRGASAVSARERAGRLETLFANSPLAQLECDSAGRVIAANAAAERLFGTGHEHLVGHAFSSLLRGPFAASKAFAGAKDAISIEVEVAVADGQTRVCTANFTPIAARDGRAPGFGVILSNTRVPA